MIVCKDNIFILETKNTYYVLGVDKLGKPSKAQKNKKD